MSQYSTAEHAIDYYEHPTFYCREPGCHWRQDADTRTAQGRAELAEALFRERNP